jgi:hypothetical protein
LDNVRGTCRDIRRLLSLEGNQHPLGIAYWRWFRKGLNLFRHGQGGLRILRHVLISGDVWRAA